MAVGRLDSPDLRRSPAVRSIVGYHVVALPSSMRTIPVVRTLYRVGVCLAAALVLCVVALTSSSAWAGEEFNQSFQLDSPFVGGEQDVVSDWPGLGVEGQDALSVPAEGPSGGSTYASWSSYEDAGQYDIQVYIPTEHADADATYYFGTANGTDTVTFNQASYGGRWADFGRFPLDAGLATITSSNDVGTVGQELGWSGARWIWIPQPETPPPTNAPAPTSPIPPSVPSLGPTSTIVPVTAHAHIGGASGNERRTLAEIIAESKFIATHVSHDGLMTTASPLTETVSMKLDHGITLSAKGNPRLSIFPKQRRGSFAKMAAHGLVLFRSTASDTNTAVQLLGSRGLRIFEILRGPKSPRRFSFAFHLPTGTKLVRATDGRAEVQTMSGQLIYGVSAPWAFDKAGHKISTHFSIAGSNQLILHVSSARATYPIVVDPELVDVALDVGVWTAEQVLKHFNQTINIEPAVCELTGIACKETAYAPSDQEAAQLGLTPNAPTPQATSQGTGIQTLTPDGSGTQQQTGFGQTIDQYECSNDLSNIGIYVAPGHYWHNNFIAQAGVITGGSVGLGANSDGRGHTAEVGVYSDPGLTRPIGAVFVNVSGYGGARFSFARPIPVAAGEELFFGVKGVGNFTVYDNRTGCMIGALEGHS